LQWVIVWCAGVLVRWCAGVLVCWCADVLVCWCGPGSLITRAPRGSDAAFGLTRGEDKG
jgi:hypothetical protein